MIAAPLKTSKSNKLKKIEQTKKISWTNSVAYRSLLRVKFAYGTDFRSYKFTSCSA